MLSMRPKIQVVLFTSRAVQVHEFLDRPQLSAELSSIFFWDYYQINNGFDNSRRVHDEDKVSNYKTVNCSS